MSRTHRTLAVALAVATAGATASAEEPKKHKGAKEEVVVVEAPTATVAVPAAEAIPAGEEADRPGFSVAALVGFAAGSGGSSSFATGVRGGYTFPFHLYLGGDLTFYIAGGSFISIAPEVGYDIALPVGVPLLVRPYVGLGFADATAGGVAAFALYPGAELLYDINRNLFVGGDLRVPVFLFSGGGLGATGTVAAFNLMGTIGYKF